GDVEFGKRYHSPHSRPINPRVARARTSLRSEEVGVILRIPFFGSANAFQKSKRDLSAPFGSDSRPPPIPGLPSPPIWRLPYALGDADDHQRDKPGGPDSDDDVPNEEPGARGHRVAPERAARSSWNLTQSGIRLYARGYEPPSTERSRLRLLR